MTTFIKTVDARTLYVQESAEEVNRRIMQTKTGMIKLTRDNTDDTYTNIWVVTDNIVSFEEE